MRLESPTYDVLRFVGNLSEVDQEYQLCLDKDMSHCFQAKFQSFDVALDQGFNLTRLGIQTKIQLSVHEY